MTAMAAETEPSDRLDGWKDVAAYLGKSVRTVQRWESEYGLPIHRIPASRGEVIWASRTELDQWRTDPRAPSDGASLSPQIEPELAYSPTPVTARPRWRRWLPWASGLLLGSVLAAGAGAVFSRVAPELAVWGPTTAQQGVTFNLEISRVSSEMAERWTQPPTGVAEQLGDPVSVAADGTSRWNFTTDCATETGSHKVWVVDLRSGRSSEPLDIVVLRNPACGRPLPDLAVTAVNLDRGQARPGESLTIEFALWNVGAIGAVATLTRIRLGKESSRSRVTDIVLGDFQSPALASGGHVVQTVRTALPLDVTPGIYYVWVVGDNTSLTTEPSGFNNFARSAPLAIHPR